MNPAHHYTLAEVCAILIGAFIINLCLHYRDRISAERAEQCRTNPTQAQCQPTKEPKT